jgi:hypothetical protein
MPDNAISTANPPNVSRLRWPSSDSETGVSRGSGGAPGRTITAPEPGVAVAEGGEVADDCSDSSVAVGDGWIVDDATVSVGDSDVGDAVGVGKGSVGVSVGVDGSGVAVGAGNGSCVDVAVGSGAGVDVAVGGRGIGVSVSAGMGVTVGASVAVGMVGDGVAVGLAGGNVAVGRGALSKPVIAAISSMDVAGRPASPALHDQPSTSPSRSSLPDGPRSSASQAPPFQPK